MDTELFRWVILPLLIFFARVSDVTIGTIRIIFVAKGYKILAPLLGFFEVLIWLLAIGQIMKNLDNFLCYIAYAAGFATGNFVGLSLGEKLASGKQLVRIITQKDASELIEALRKRGLGVTRVNAEGREGLVHLIFTIVKGNEIPVVMDMISKYNPNAFHSIEDVRHAKDGVFSARRNPFTNELYKALRFPDRFRALVRLHPWRKGK